MVISIPMMMIGATWFDYDHRGGRVLSSGRISFFDWNDNQLLIIDKH